MSEYKYPENLSFDASLSKIVTAPVNYHCTFCDGSADYIFTVEDEKAKEWQQHSRTWILCGDCSKKLYKHIMNGISNYVFYGSVKT